MRRKFPPLVSVLLVLMHARGWTRADLARGLGVSQATVSRWFAGEEPSLANLRAACDLLGAELCIALRTNESNQT